MLIGKTFLWIGILSLFIGGLIVGAKDWRACTLAILFAVANYLVFFK